MIDLGNAIAASDYRRHLLLGEAEQDRIAKEALSGYIGGPSEARPSLLGVLVAALLAIVATGAIAPR